MDKLINSLVSSRDQLTIQIMTARYDDCDMNLHDALCLYRINLDGIIDGIKKTRDQFAFDDDVLTLASMENDDLQNLINSL